MVNPNNHLSAAPMRITATRLNESTRYLQRRNVEGLLAEKGIVVSRESIPLRCIKFGVIYLRRLKRTHRGYGDTFSIDEVLVKINGKQRYLWCAALP